MADVCDRAQEYIDQEMAALLARPVAVVGPSAEFCEECDEPIPELRRVTLPGVRLCVDCQQLQE